LIFFFLELLKLGRRQKISFYTNFCKKKVLHVRRTVRIVHIDDDTPFRDFKTTFKRNSGTGSPQQTSIVSQYSWN